MVFRRVKPGAVFALEPDAVKATIDECAARSPDWGRFVAWLLNEDVTLRPTAAFVVKTLKPIVAELYSPSESSEEVKSPSKGAGTAPPPPDTQEDGDAPPPSYEEAQPQPKQPVLRFPEIVMEPVPAPTKLEVDERRAPSTNSSPQRHDGSHSPSSPATAASRQPTSGQRPAQAASSPRQPPATRPPPAAQTQPAFRGPPVASQYSLPNAEPVPNHRSPWMDEVCVSRLPHAFARLWLTHTVLPLPAAYCTALDGDGSRDILLPAQPGRHGARPTKSCRRRCGRGGTVNIGPPVVQQVWRSPKHWPHQGMRNRLLSVHVKWRH